MAISFPGGSKSNGQKFTHQNKSWTWDGNSWKGGVSSGSDAGTLDSLNSTQFLRSDTNTSTSGSLGIGVDAPVSPLHIKKTGTNVTLLTLENYYSDISGLGNQGNYIDFKMTDDNVTATPQVRIGMHVYDNDGTDSGQASEGTGNFLIYTMEGTDSLGNGNLTEKLRVTEKGNVGIGTASPSAMLEFGGNTTDNRYDIKSPADNARGIGLGNYTTFSTRYSNWDTLIGTNIRSKIGTSSSGEETASSYTASGGAILRIGFQDLQFKNYSPAELSGLAAGSDVNSLGTTRFTIDASGNLDIGGSAGSMKLNVNGDIYLGDNSSITNGLYGGGNIVVSSDNDVLIIGDGNTSSPSAASKVTIGLGNTANINYDSLRGAALDSLNSPAVVTAEFYTDHVKMLKQLKLLTSSSDPSSPKTGAVYYNTTSDHMRIYNGNDWVNVSDGPFIATGGVVTTSGSYRIHTFTSSGTFSVTGTKNVEILIVAGAGGGGADNAGGGGAGGLRYYGAETPKTPNGAAVQVTNGNYSIVVGAGGRGGTVSSGGSGSADFSINGSNSSALGFISIGGGAGACSEGGAGSPPGSAGGSGGGGNGNSDNTVPYQAGSGTSGQGNNGGTGASGGGGGGGGAGAVGQNGNVRGSQLGGEGGEGLQYSISGSSNWYSAGGGGGNENSVYNVQSRKNGISGSTNTASNTRPSDGIANTGAGGGGGTHSSATPTGQGGSGIVIIRYLM